MSDRGPEDTEGTGETFVGRWSRLKQQARDGAQLDSAAPLPAATARAPEPPPPEPAAALVVELPDLAQLDQDSDYSAFLTPGVDAALRRRALRQLFSSPKFNVFDGLDTYRDDFRNFAPLGDVVTADMRHHVERLAREAARALETPTGETQPAATAAVAATPLAPGSDDREPPADTLPPDTDEHLDQRPD